MRVRLARRAMEGVGPDAEDGSTGGVTRFLLDGYAEPDVATFLATR